MLYIAPLSCTMPMLSLSLLFSTNAYIAFDFIAFASLRKTLPPQCGSLHYIAVAVHHLTLRFPCVTSPIIALAIPRLTLPYRRRVTPCFSLALQSTQCFTFALQRLTSRCLCTSSWCYAVPCLCCATLVRCGSVSMPRITPRYVTMPLLCFALP